MEWLETVQMVLGYMKDAVMILLAVVAWLMNRNLSKVAKIDTSAIIPKLNSTGSKILDSDENNKNAEVSAKESSMVSKTIETPVTTVQRELQVTLSEHEVESLRQVIAASGRSSEVKDVYDAFTTFQTKIK